MSYSCICYNFDFVHGHSLHVLEALPLDTTAMCNETQCDSSEDESDPVFIATLRVKTIMRTIVFSRILVQL